MKIYKAENKGLNFKGTKNLGQQLVEGKLPGTVKLVVVLLLTFSMGRILSLGLSKGLEFRSAFLVPSLKVTTFKVSGNMVCITLL